MHRTARLSPVTRHAAALAGLVVGLAAASNTHGSTIEIAGNFGPGDSFNIVSSFLVLGPDEISIGNVDQAVPFSTGDEAVFATHIDVAMRLNDGHNGVALSIYSDNGGLPGMPLISTALGGLPTGNFAEIRTATFGAPFLLDANTNYWVVADAGLDSDISWNWNDIGMMLKAGRSGTPVGPWNVSADVMTPAFRVSGRAVPGPGALAAFAGLGVLAARRRRND